MITRTPSRRAETAAADIFEEDDGGYLDGPFSPISNSSSRASIAEHISTATTDTVKYVVRYSTAVLHHLVSECLVEHEESSLKNIAIHSLRRSRGMVWNLYIFCTRDLLPNGK